MNYHNTLDALCYYQLSAECYAAYLQAFNLARLRLLQELQRLQAEGVPSERFYLVSDCDETLLDNSNYNVWLAQTGRDYHESTWSEWCQKRQALATPGALEFAQFAVEHGVQLIYVSSRFERDRQVTADNLLSLGFPLPDSSTDPVRTYLFLSGMSLEGRVARKAEQFAYLKQRYQAPPLLHLGDNLSDHDAELFGSRVSRQDRQRAAQHHRERWGNDWIVFPNPIYGGWRNLLPGDEDPPHAPQADPVRSPLSSPKGRLLRPWSGT